MADSSPRAPMVVTHQGGLRFATQIRSHTLVVDQPVHAGGEDAGPMPIELLGASLGTCIALYVQRFLDARGLPYEGMRVEVGTRGAKEPARIAEFDVKVVLPAAVPEPYATMLERVARSCPAHGTLTHEAEVRVSIEAPVEVGAE